MIRRNNKINCCLNCESRYLGCHSECITYNEEIKKNREFNNLVFNKSKINRDIANYKIEKEIKRRKRERKYFIKY